MPTLTAKRVVKYGFIIFGSIGLLFYIYIQSRTYLTGPQLSITAPLNGSSVTEKLVTIEGTAQNVSFIQMNGNQIFIDSEGNFVEKLLLDPGYNIIEVTVTDRFERSLSSQVSINYAASEDVRLETFDAETSFPAKVDIDNDQNATSTNETQPEQEE